MLWKFSPPGKNTFTHFTWFRDEKMKSSSTEDTDLMTQTLLVAKSNRSVLCYWETARQERKVELFHCDFSLPQLGRTSDGPGTRFLL